MFSKLSRRDRLRAIHRVDEFDLRISPDAGDLFEFDAGLVGQLVVGLTEMIYYSEWQGYDDFSAPPSERVDSNDSKAVQSWHQTGYPGFSEVFVDSLGETRTPGPAGRLDLTDIMNKETARKADTHDEYLSRFYERLK